MFNTLTQELEQAIKTKKTCGCNKPECVIDSASVDALIEQYKGTESAYIFNTVLQEFTGVFPVEQCPKLSLVDDQIFVNYYPTLQKLVAQKSTHIKLGRYIKKTYPAFLDHTVVVIQERIRALLSVANYRIVFSLPVQRSEDRESIADYWETVYKTPLKADPATTCNSCMTGKDFVRAYACQQRGDKLLLLATLVDDAGRVVARSIVFGNGSIKHYLRPYADSLSALAVFKLKLNQLGIKLKSSLNGYYIQGSYNTYGFPYLDGKVQRITRWDDNVFLIDEHGDYGLCDNTDGTVDLFHSEDDYDDPDLTNCTECGDRTFYDSTYTNEWGDICVCSGCFNELYCFARLYSRYDREHTDLVLLSDAVCIDGEYYVDDAESLNNLGFVYIEDHERWVSQDDAIYLDHLESFYLIEDIIEIDPFLYPDVSEDERNYPQYDPELVQTATGEWIFTKDAIEVFSGFGSSYVVHPYQVCIDPNKVYQSVAQFLPSTSLPDLIKAIQELRVVYSNEYYEETGYQTEDFTAAHAYYGMQQLSLSLEPAYA